MTPLLTAAAPEKTLDRCTIVGVNRPLWREKPDSADFLMRPSQNPDTPDLATSTAEHGVMPALETGVRLARPEKHDAGGAACYIVQSRVRVQPDQGARTMDLRIGICGCGAFARSFIPLFTRTLWLARW